MLHHREKPKKEHKQEQEPWRNAACWLVLHGFLSCFLVPGKMPRGGTTHSELGPPTSIINDKHASTDLLSGQSDGDISSVKVPPCFLDDLA